MQIDIQITPNTNAKKFIIINLQNKIKKSYFFQTVEKAQEYSALAVELFKTHKIDAIFLFQNFITITKKSNIEWHEIEQNIIDKVNLYLKNNPDLINIKQKNNTENPPSNLFTNKDSIANKDIINKIEELLETRIRPSIALDGGDVMFKEYKNGIVKVALLGACVGCGQATITLKNGIESLLKYYIPEIKSVECDEI
ncbi:MAG: NifU family protein [Pseudomonadota bacterium]